MTIETETLTDWTKEKINPYQNLLTAAQLKALPSMYGTENVDPEKKIIQVHFFYGSYDGYFCEFDPVEGLFYGWVSLNGADGEWGYTSAEELCSVHRIERDLYFTPKPASDVSRIMQPRMQ